MGIKASSAQSTGDTIVVETFNYTQTYGVNQWSPGIRDTTIDFPSDSNVSYEKILMLYNMRCKDANVSTSSERDKGCGEWDISCNTYIHDSTSIDSLANTIPSHSISNFSGTTYSYTTQPTYNYYRYLQPNATVTNIINESQSTVGVGVISLDHVLATMKYNGNVFWIYINGRNYPLLSYYDVGHWLFTFSIILSSKDVKGVLEEKSEQRNAKNKNKKKGVCLKKINLHS